MENIKNILGKFIGYAVFVISMIAGLVLVLSIASIDSESETPFIGLFASLAWFVLVYATLKIGVYIEEKQAEKNQQITI